MSSQKYVGNADCDHVGTRIHNVHKYLSRLHALQRKFLLLHSLHLRIRIQNRFISSDEVRDAPNVDDTIPVSRHQEFAIRRERNAFHTFAMLTKRRYA